MTIYCLVAFLTSFKAFWVFHKTIRDKIIESLWSKGYLYNSPKRIFAKCKNELDKFELIATLL